MKKCILLLSTAFVLLCLTTFTLKAQVTIGSSEIPNAGSLLDLKQTSSGSENASKGLVLPRVELTSLGNLFPMFSGIQTYIDNTNNKKTDEDANHIGLVVFNTNQCLLGTEFSRGVFIWSGVDWNLVTAKKNNPASDINLHTDARTGNTFKARRFGQAGEWMVENLTANTYTDGQSLAASPSVATSTSDNTKRWAYPNKTGASVLNATVYNKQAELGYLFNWYAAVGQDAVKTVDEAQGQPNELAVGYGGICPSGWHLPSDVEWNMLEDAIRKDLASFSSLATASTTDNLVALGNRGDYSQAMRAVCLPIETPSVSDGKSYSQYNGGFAVYAAGSLPNSYNTNQASGYGTSSSFWSASSRGAGQVWMRKFVVDEKTVDRNVANATDMLSVRCKLTEGFSRCGDMLRDTEGNAYQTASFGGAGCWMTQNLISTKNSLITLSQNVNTNNEEIPYYAKPNTTATDATYGYLYTWTAAMGKSVAEETFISVETSVKASTIQGICPDGWVLPSEADWNTLEAEIAKNSTTYSTNATSIDWAGQTYATQMSWRRPGNNTTGWGQNMRSTELVNNASHQLASKSKPANAGFAALLVGSLESGTAQTSFGNTSNMWTSNDVFTPIGGDTNARYRGLSQSDNGVYRSDASKSSMLSVRCKKK